MGTDIVDVSVQCRPLATVLSAAVLAAAIAGGGGNAHAAWIQNTTVGPSLYTDPANWNGGTIDNTFSADPTTGLNVTWNADYTLTGALTLSYAGSQNVTFRSDSATPRTIKLAGNWTKTAGGGALTIGTAANPLVLDLNGAARSFGFTSTAGDFHIYAKITDSIPGTGHGITLGNGTGFTHVYNNASDFTGQVRFLRRGGSFSSIRNVGGGPSALGAPTTVANGTVYVADATSWGGLTYTGSGDTSNREWQWDNTSWSGITHGGSGTLTLTGDQTWTRTTYNITGTYSANGGNVALTGVLKPSGTQVNAMVFTSNQSYDTRTITLGNANRYLGKTTVGAVTLEIGSLRDVGAGASSLGAPATAGNGTVAIGATTATGRLRYTGAGDSTDRVIDLAGTTGGAWIENNGSGALVFESACTATGAGSKTLTLGGTNTDANELRGAIVNNSAANKTSLTKDGPGAWALSGVGAYTGPTTVKAGTLRVNTPAASGSGTGDSLVTVEAGGVLGGGGRIDGAVTVKAGGRLCPGAAAAAIGTLTVYDNVELQEEAILAWRGSPMAGDRVVCTGNIRLPAVLHVEVAFDGGIPDPAVLFEWGGANTGATDLSRWVITDGLTALIRDKQVLLRPPAVGTVILVK